MVQQHSTTSKLEHKKILYEEPHCPDNYTDEATFLCDLQKNIELREVSVVEAVYGASLLIQQLCTVIIFVVSYIYLYNEWIDAQFLFYFSSIFTTCGYVFYKLFYSPSKSKLGTDLRTALIFIVFGNLFSPVLHTLTDTISTDTIYTMTFLMMLIHLFFFNYGAAAANVSNSLSLNSAIFGSVCLASRLSSSYHAFVLMSIAVKCFVLFPLLRCKINNSPLVTLTLVVLILHVLVLLSTIMTALFIMVLIFVNIICPIMFTKYQKYKDNIYGPWDEAIVDDKNSMNDSIYC